MKTYLLKRLLAAIPSLLIASVIVFVLPRLLPGDAVLLPEPLCDKLPVAGRGQACWKATIRRDHPAVHEVMRPAGVPDVIAAGAEMVRRFVALDERLSQQLDPYYLAPQWVDTISLAALQARLLLDQGLVTERDMAEVVARRPAVAESQRAAELAGVAGDD